MATEAEHTTAESTSGPDLRTAVRNSVAELLGQVLSPEEDALILADLHPTRYDSLGVLECVGIIEERMGISVDLVDDDLRVTFRSVASITELVERKRRDAAVLKANP